MKQLDITVNWKALKARRKAARMENKRMLTKEQEQKERKALAGSTTDATTFHQLSSLDQSLGGRFAIPGGPKPDVSGEEPVVRYPRLPSSSPWSHDPTGVERPTGYRIDDLEACGTFEEISASVASQQLSFPAGEMTGEAPPPKLTEELLGDGGGALIARAAALPSPNPGSAAEDRRAALSLDTSTSNIETPLVPPEVNELLELLFSKTGRSAR